MKKVFFLFLSVLFTLSIVSCEKCATCKFNDPEQGEITSDFCSKGRTYTDQLESHEDKGWSCSEE